MKIVIDLLNGALDGTTLVGNDTGDDARLIDCFVRGLDSEEAAQEHCAIVIYRDTGGVVGKCFAICVPDDQPAPKYPLQTKVEYGGCNDLITVEYRTVVRHQFEIVGRLEQDGELLVQAKAVAAPTRCNYLISEVGNHTTILTSKNQDSSG